MGDNVDMRSFLMEEASRRGGIDDEYEQARLEIKM